MAPPFDSAGMDRRADGSVRRRLPAAPDLSLIWSRLGPALAGWLLPFALIVYLGLKGGGYDDVIRGEVGIAVSWILLLGALVGVLPTVRIGRAGWVGLGLLTAFGAWTALGISWSGSAGNSVAEVGRLAMLTAVFALALCAQGRAGVRRTVSAVAAAIGLIAALALLSRLHPSWFPANDAARFLPSTRSRLNYPLNYWNGLAALVVMGIPLMLALATRARSVALRALAAAAVPAMALTSYYTFSRGGALELAVALVVLVVLHPRRLSLLPTLVVGGAGSAILVAAASQRGALDHGLTNGAAQGQGNEMLAIVLVVCAGVGLLQAALALAARHDLGPRIRVGRRGTLGAWAVVAVAAITVALAVGAPGKLSHDWNEFKSPSGAASDSADRFLSASGSGRYQTWQAAVHANGTDPLIGIGPGTYQYWWAQHATIPDFVVNAHSLYLESLAELGIVGLVLIAGLVIWVLANGARRALTASRDRTLFAGATAAVAAFAVAAAIDWTWQIAVIPVAFLLLAAAILRPRLSSAGDEEPARPWLPRLVLVALSLAALVAIAIPLAATEAVRSSQAEARSGDLNAALADARTARDIQPYSATASLQEALVLERAGDLHRAAAAARHATEQAADDWRNWLVLSRLEAERGNASQALADYRRAKSLNPRSPLFKQ